MKHLFSKQDFWIKSGISMLYFSLVVLHFSPVSLHYKGAFPLLFLTLCSLMFSSRTMMLAMFFSALGDYMGIISNFWGQMLSFALAHVAFISYFRQELQTKSWIPSFSRKWLIIWIIIYFLIASHIEPFSLRIGVMVYALLILIMCSSACQHPNKWYAVGAILFVFSDFMLAWNKFNFHIPGIRYWIMIPYLTGQWMLFIQSVKSR